MKRCLVLSDSFKGTLSSPDICRIARSLHIPGWHIDALPVADGGEGTTDCFLDACGGQRIALPVSGPFGGTIDGFYGLLPDGTAVVECAAAAGLHQAEGRPDPEAATTYGVGQLLAHALDHGAKRLILGLGGSCTNDGGCGAAAALGVRFYDRQGRGFVPTGGTLADIEAIDLSGRHPGLRPGVLTVMCDIDNPLYGETGAAYIFAPQKGANDACVQRLDAGLRHLAAVLHAQLSAEVDTPAAVPPAASARAALRCCVVPCAPVSRRCWTPWTSTAAQWAATWWSPARVPLMPKAWAARPSAVWQAGVRSCMSPLPCWPGVWH